MLEKKTRVTKKRPPTMGSPAAGAAKAPAGRVKVERPPTPTTTTNNNNNPSSPPRNERKEKRQRRSRDARHSQSSTAATAGTEATAPAEATATGPNSPSRPPPPKKARPARMSPSGSESCCTCGPGSMCMTNRCKCVKSNSFCNHCACKNCRKGVTAVVDVKVKDLDAKSCRKRNPEKVLRAAELAKRRKDAEECGEECKDFAPFVVSRDGMVGREARNLTTRLAKTLHQKWNIPFSRTSFFVKSRMSLAMLRSTTHVLCGERKIMEVRREQPAFFHDNSALLGYWSTSRWS